jgi:hypothetical protein
VRRGRANLRAFVVFGTLACAFTPQLTAAQPAAPHTLGAGVQLSATPSDATGLIEPGPHPVPPPVPTPLAAPTDETARPTFEAGRRAYENGRYAEALDLFQSVFVSTGHPTMLVNIANTHVRLGEPRRAAAALEQYLALVPEATDQAALRTRIAELKREPELLEPPLPPAPPPAAPEPSPTPSSGLIAGRTFTWVALGTSLVFGGVAGALWMNANQSFERLALTCGVNGSCSNDQVATVTEGVSATNLCLAASGIALLSAVVLFIVEGDDDPAASSESPQLRAGIEPGGASLSIAGRL